MKNQLVSSVTIQMPRIPESAWKVQVHSLQSTKDLNVKDDPCFRDPPVAYLGRQTGRENQGTGKLRCAQAETSAEEALKDKEIAKPQAN